MRKQKHYYECLIWQPLLVRLIGELFVSSWSACRKLSAMVVLAIFFCQCAAARAQLSSAPEPSAAEPSAPVQPVSSTSPSEDAVVQAQDEAPVVESFVLPAEQHAWARFPAGTWREIRTTTETFDEAGALASRSVTTQQESLQSASDERYALDVQATVDLVGKRITGKWINRVLQNVTDGPGPIISSRRLEDRSITLANNTVNCQVWEVAYSDEARSLVDRIFYAPDQYPYILRRETSAETSVSDGELPVEQVQSVVAGEVPYLVDGQVLPCTCLKTTRHTEKGSSVRVSLVTPQIPGGEVAVWSTVFDPRGQRSRWSSQELVDYGQGAPAKPGETRRQTRRARRRNR